jgi:hypothetical protein
MFRKTPLTSLAILVTLAVVVFSIFSEKNWNKDGAVISGDAKVYYLYLPAIFINNDLDLENLDPYLRGNNQLVWYNETVDGKRYIKGTYGMAFMYSPFFFAGHALAAALGEPMDGFSYPYTFCLSFSGLIYLLIGLVFLSKLLLRYFRDHVVAVTLLVIVLGTNALFYFSGHMMYTHGPNFMLLSIILYASMMWFDTHRWKWTIAIGVCGALITLIRPIDILFVLFLPLLGVVSMESLKARLKEMWAKRMHFVVIGVIFVLIFTPQFIYNYHVSGEIFFYSYSDESFFFGSPEIYKTMFSYRNGWLVYSPLMVLSLLGFITLFRSQKKLALYAFAAFAVYVYVLASWWCWWYAGFGNRAFINLYPILALPLAALIHAVFSKGILIRSAFNLILLLGIMLSVFQTDQFRKGFIHWGDMTKNAYWDLFLKEAPSQLFPTYLEPVVIDRQKKREDCVFKSKVEEINSVTYTFDNLESMDSTLNRFWNQSEGEIQVPLGDEYAGNIRMYPNKEANEIYLTAWVDEAGCDSTILVLKYEKGYFQLSSEVVERKGDMVKIHCYMVIPEEVWGKVVNMYFWNQNKKPFRCDELTASFRKRTRYVKCLD